MQRRAERVGSVLEVPAFEDSAEALHASVRSVKREGDRALGRIGKVGPGRETFANTLWALDTAVADVTEVLRRAVLLREVSGEPALREAGAAATEVLGEWLLGVSYREDLHGAVKRYAARATGLTGEERRLLEVTLREYRRAGWELSVSARQSVEQGRRQLLRLGARFRENAIRAEAELEFAAEELDGLPSGFLESPMVELGAGRFRVCAEVPWQFGAVMTYAHVESTRRRVLEARYRLAMGENEVVLGQILTVRSNLARVLGMASWADYQAELSMAGRAERAVRFVRESAARQQEEWDRVLAALQRLKAEDTGNPEARIEHWDWWYYDRRLQEAAGLPAEQEWRGFFPFGQTVDGLLGAIETCFGVRVLPVPPPRPWAADVLMCVLADGDTGEPLGVLYLDLFRRADKFSHFGVFNVVPGRQLASGKRRCPVAVLVGSYPNPPADGGPYFSWGEVQTLCHELGHAVQSLLSRTRFAQLAGGAGTADFVEVPAQLLERWARDPAVLAAFARHHAYPQLSMPAELGARIEAARMATRVLSSRRQLGLGLADLWLHGADSGGHTQSGVRALANAAMAELFLGLPEDTSFVATFGHLVGGYDAGYYGYGWAEAIVESLAPVFEGAAGGWLDPVVGRRFRREVLEYGGARDPAESIRAFLGQGPGGDEFWEPSGGR